MKLMLITKEELDKLPTGMELYSILGKKVVVGKDAIDEDTRGGLLAFGFKLDDDTEHFNWDTEK